MAAEIVFGDLHVVLASWDDDPPVGGQGVHVRSLREQLLRRGVRVTTVAGRGPYAMRYRRLTGHGPLDMSMALNLKPAPLLKATAQLVHAQGGPGGLQLIRGLPLPLVYTANHTFRQAHPLCSVRRAYSLVERCSYHRAAMVLALSASTATTLQALGVPRQHIEVVSPGIEIARFDRGDTFRQRGRILFVGRLEPEKGPLDAIAVMSALAAADQAISGVVVGTGSLDAAVRRAANACPHGAVEVRGALTDDELAREYARADILLMPSAYEGLGLVALEAMAAGAAVVAYDVTGLRDAVGTNGILIPYKGIKRMSIECRALLDDRPRKTDMTRRAREAVRSQYSPEREADVTEQIYRAVLVGG
jgi:glycosyltransferase involved in cell wall biosynthesis